MTIAAEELDAKVYIPHRGRMALIDTIVWIDRARIAGEVRAQLQEGAPYFKRAVFQTHWLIELGAQASAAIAQASRVEGDVPSPFGFLISIRRFTMNTDVQLKPGDELLFDVVFEVEMSPMGQSRCVVTSQGRVIGEGEMTFLTKESHSIG